MVPQRMRLFALLAVVGLATACDSPNQVATKSIVAPRHDATSSGGYTLMTTDANTDQTKTAVIDQSGGFIRFQGSSLIVPANAVTGPTTFTMRLHTQPYMGAELSAVGEDGQLITVFPVPLTLTLSYARAKNQLPTDANSVMVAWVDNGVVLATLPSTADIQGKKVTAQVTHFTEYSPIQYDPLNPTNPTLPPGQN